MAKKRLISCFLLVCTCFMLAGCWDRRELQDRNFVLAVGIDLADDGQKPGVSRKEAAKIDQVETFVQAVGIKRYRLSLQLLKFKQGDDKGEASTYVISNTGESFFEMIRDMLGQSSKSLWFEHLQLIVISEAVLKQAGLSEILDFFKRDSEMRSRIKVYVTDGAARSLLEYTPPSKEAGGIFLSDLIRLHFRNNHVVGTRTDLGYTIRYFDSNSNILLPRIKIADSVIKLDGAAVFKKDRFIGYADGYTIAGLKFIYGTEEAANITTESPSHPGQQITFELYRNESKFMPHVEENGTIYFTLDVNLHGNLGEIQENLGEENTLDPVFLHQLELAFAQEVKQNIIHSDHYFRQELQVDCVSKFAAKMKAYQPVVWEQVKEEWDEICPTIPLYVSVNVSIEGIGSHK